MNKVAIITGISYGLGESIALNLLDQDFKVYGISQTQPKIHKQQFS